MTMKMVLTCLPSCVMAAIILLTAGCQPQQTENTSRPAAATVYSLQIKKPLMPDTTKYRNLASKLQPGVILWIVGEAGKISDPQSSAEIPPTDIQTRFHNQRLNQDTINTMQILILIQAIDSLDKQITELEAKRSTADSGMVDELSLKLQILMERRSQLIQALSNILKKTGQTEETIVQNLK